MEWALTITNRGDAAVANVVARATLPPELKVTAADGGAVGPGSVEWKLGELKAGEKKALKLTCDAVALAPKAGVTVVVLGDAVSNGTPVGTPVEGKADAAVAVIGTPALALELATPPGIVDVGRQVRYEVRVKNRGTVSARNIDVTAIPTAELKPVRGSGAGDGRIEANGRVTFPTIEELQPGQTLTFVIEVDAAKAGDARFRVEVNAAHLKSPLKEEQATRVTGR